jgi:hypothetical protein
MSKVEKTCLCGCGQKFFARKADIARGWGKFATKSCKAKDQEKRTGQYSRLIGLAVPTEFQYIDDADDEYWLRKGE